MKLVALSLLAFFSAQIVADRAELRLQPKQDQAITYKVTTSTKTVLELQGQKVESQNDVQRSYVVAFKGENDDGSLNVGLTYGPIRGKSSLPMGMGAVEFDSEKPIEAKNPLLAATAKTATLEAGIEVALKLSRKSEILEAAGLSDQLKSRLAEVSKGNPMMSQAVQAKSAKLSDDHARRALVAIVPRLPPTALAVGEEFTLANGFHHCHEGKCTEFDPKGKVVAIDERSVTVELQGECPHLAAEDDDPDLIEKFTVRSLTMKGKFVFSRVDGFLDSLELEEVLSAYQPSPAGAVPVVNAVTTKFARAS